MQRSVGAVYYVATEGNDGHNGLSVETPFRTIGRAAALMQAGDTCLVREGVYRETVRPAASGTAGAPIRFAAYPGETATISGCDRIERWARREGDVYEGEMPWSLGEGNGNIVFVDGELSHEAMWPAIADRLDRSQYAVVDAATNTNESGAIFDEDLLAFPDGYWDGAIIACVHGVSYFISTARVTRFAAGTLYYEQWVSSAPYYHAGKGNYYFLTRTPQALGAAHGWLYEEAGGKLLWQAPAGERPEQHEIEAKRRDYAFDLRERSYVEVSGFHCRAASLTTESAEHCRLEKLRLVGIDRYFGSRQSIYGRTKGVELGGTNNELRDSEISQFEGIGVNLSGARNRVVNCYIHDGNFEASYASLVWIRGAEHLVSRCTITRAGRTCVSGVFGRTVIEYCDISHANCLTKDSGIVYLFNHDFDNTDIHHNWLHDNESDHLSFGFYMDAWTSGVNFYRNVVWNIPHHAVHMNRPIQRSLLYNNTFHRSATTNSSVFCLDDMSGVQVVNNIFADSRITDWGEDSLVSHNMFETDPRFVDADNGDYRLREDSPARGKGRRITGLTEPEAGDTPDLGAYAYGGEHWVPGHDFARETQAELQVDDFTSKSKLFNCGFETGALDPWRTASGSPTLACECAWDYSSYGYASVVRSNRYSAMLAGGDAIEQTVTGLAPNTTYTFWANVRTAGLYRQATQHDERHVAGELHRAPDGGDPVYRDAAYVGPLREGDWLRFAAIDFTGGLYDAFAVGVTKVAAPLVLEARLDGPDGKLLGTVSFASDYDNVWQYFAGELQAASGVHDLVFVVKGTGRCLFQGFKLFHAFRGSPVRISVNGHGGEERASQFIRLNWDARPDRIAFTTGPESTSAVVAIANKGKYTVYVDDCGLWNPDVS
ncbi:right-handed parallel beta-helix repeat-containing protein [Paenibacillus cymbidii]|uniref:right-handed parallel beta-helix repeat-containing protein n=1 Tax=Paenibacillus cymbidii TaxID=1639034 RepID=UPI001081F512|nr:right-handed parallel beta-helix repeat-containing protein [Paenibacillus cymbidii]